MEVLYQDRKREIAGEERFVIPEGLLQCDEGISAKEVIDTVSRVVAAVAEDHGANTATALAAAKAAMVDAVEADEELPPLGRHRRGVRGRAGAAVMPSSRRFPTSTCPSTCRSSARTWSARRCAT